MKKQDDKNEIWFAVAWIVLYVVGTSMADNLSAQIGINKVFTLPFLLLLTATAVYWVHKQHLFEKYGLCKTPFKASRFCFYLPLLVPLTVNGWFGVKMNMPLHETLLYIGSMLCVGFLEELIFRGFLFCAMAKDNVRSAIAVSSITFGIGHIVNLINGSGAGLVENLCQVCYAMAIGWLFVTLFYRGKSLWPCIAVHSAVNAFSAFADQTAMNSARHIAVAVVICITAVGYTLLLHRTLPNPQLSTTEKE